MKGNLLLKLTPQTPSWRRLPNLPAIRYETEVRTYVLPVIFTLIVEIERYIKSEINILAR